VLSPGHCLFYAIGGYTVATGSEILFVFMSVNEFYIHIYHISLLYYLKTPSMIKIVDNAGM
jgi:hypothetical protein